jgi:hypothetical protein
VPQHSPLNGFEDYARLSGSDMGAFSLEAYQASLMWNEHGKLWTAQLSAISLLCAEEWQM